MEAVLNWLWQGSVVAVAWFAMLRLLDRARANVRYVVCWAALLLIVALPTLPWLEPAVPQAEAFGSSSPKAIVSLPDSWWTSVMAMFSAWCVWAGMSTVRFLSAVVGLRRARRRSRAFPAHLEPKLREWNRIRFEGRRASLVLSGSVKTAAVLGWGTPMIAVAPSVVRALDPAELDRVLIHEWAHVQRRDDLLHIVQIIIRMLAGWHPAAWWIDRRLHVEREIACDEMTVAMTGSPKSYAECLMKLASLGGTRTGVEMAPAVFMPGGLRSRITRIVTPYRFAPVWSRSIAVAIVSTLCAMAVGVGGLKLVESTAFALPASPPGTPTLNQPAPLPSPSPAAPVRRESSRRESRVRSSSAPALNLAAPPIALPKAEPGLPLTPDTVKVADVPRSIAEDDAVPAVSLDAALVVHNAEPQRSEAAAEQPRSPWGVAADTGAAIGRKSKDAGVATAGFFTRFGRRVAGSF